MKYNISKICTLINVYDEIDYFKRCKLIATLTDEEEMLLYQSALNCDYQSYDNTGKLMKALFLFFNEYCQEHLVIAYMAYKILIENPGKDILENYAEITDEMLGLEIEFEYLGNFRIVNDQRIYDNKRAKKIYEKENNKDVNAATKSIFLNDPVKTAENLSRRNNEQIRELYRGKYYSQKYSRDIAIHAADVNPYANINNLKFKNGVTLEEKNKLIKHINTFNKHLRSAKIIQILIGILLEKDYINSNFMYEADETDTVTFVELKKLQHKIIDSKKYYY